MTQAIASPSMTSASGTARADLFPNLLALLGRIGIAALFLPAGFAKLTGFAGTVGYIASAGLPMPSAGAVLAILVELGVALAFLLGYKTRAAALVLALFTLAAALCFHAYWSMPVEKQMINQLMFFKNVAIAGGLFAFAAFGAGRFAIDKR